MARMPPPKEHLKDILREMSKELQRNDSLWERFCDWLLLCPRRHLLFRSGLPTLDWLLCDAARRFGTPRLDVSEYKCATMGRFDEMI